MSARIARNGQEECTLLPRRAPLFFLHSTLALAIALAGPAQALARRSPTDVVAGVPISTHRFAAAAAPDIDAAAGILVADDGHALWSRQADAERPMASTTKLMTALVALKHGGLYRIVTVSKKASTIPDGAGLVPGERLTERQLLGLMLVRSANDAAYALGEGVGGNMPAFVKMMNDEARALGLKHTHYVNPHGLDARGHFTSAADLAKLARIVMQYAEFRRIVSSRTFAVPSLDGHGSSVFATTDKLLGAYAGLEGGKTGYTDKAGYCFVASAKRAGVSLIAVVLGTDSPGARFTQAARLLDWGFKHMSRARLAPAGAHVGTVSLVDQPATTVTGCTPATTSVSLFDLEGPIVQQVALDQRLAAPVFKGQPIGEVAWTQGKRTIARAPVVAVATVASGGEAVAEIPVSDFVDMTVFARTGDATGTPTFDPSVKVQRHVVLAPQVRAPVSEGQRLGELTYTQGGRVVASIPIVAAHSVAAPNLIDRVTTWWTRKVREVFGGRQVAELRVNEAWAQ